VVHSLLCQQLFSNRVFDVITGEASLAGLKSLARIMLLCAVYPSMISRAFVDIYSVVFLITIVLPVCQLYKWLSIDCQNPSVRKNCK
jgi:hypothetical protein